MHTFQLLERIPLPSTLSFYISYVLLQVFYLNLACPEVILEYLKYNTKEPKKENRLVKCLWYYFTGPLETIQPASALVSCMVLYQRKQATSPSERCAEGSGIDLNSKLIDKFYDSYSSLTQPEMILLVGHPRRFFCSLCICRHFQGMYNDYYLLSTGQTLMSKSAPVSLT